MHADSDQYGNTYTGEFAASTTGVRYLAGGAFDLASGASDAYPKPTGLAWATRWEATRLGLDLELTGN